MMTHVSFYCENCGRRVGPNARTCPHCGRFFSAVKCPVCNFSGEVSLFMAGCPSCGYTGEHADRKQQFEIIDLPLAHSDGSKGGVLRGRDVPRNPTGRPRWLFALTMSILALAFLVLVIIYINL